MKLPLPTWTTPVGASIKTSYKLGELTPEFITIVGDAILVEAKTPADSGVFDIDVFFTDSISGVEKMDSFKLTVNCVKSIATKGTVANLDYFITEGSSTRQAAYSLSPSACPDQLVHSATIGGNALPSWISIDAKTGIVTVKEDDLKAKEGTYKVDLVATDPGTGVKSTGVSFDINLKCTKEIKLVSGSVETYSYKIDLDAPWTESKDLPTYTQSPAGCPTADIDLALKYVGSGSAPTFVKEADGKIKISTQDLKNEGLYKYKIVATDSVSGLSNDEDEFTVAVVTADVATDIVPDISTYIKDQEYMIGEKELLLDVPTYKVEPAGSDQNLEWKLGKSTPDFVTLVQDSTGVWKIRVKTDEAKGGLYTISLRLHEEFSDINKDTTFELKVGCVTALVLGRVKNVEYFIKDTAASRAPVTTITPSVCPQSGLVYSATVDGKALPSNIKLDAATGAITVDEQADWKATGSYTVEMTVEDKVTGVKATPKTFDVEVKCIKSIDIVKESVITDFTYAIDPSGKAVAKETGMPTFKQNPSECEANIFRSIVYTGAGAAPAHIKQVGSKLQVSTSDASHVGKFSYKIVAEDMDTKMTNESNEFAIEVKDRNIPTNIVLDSIPKATY